MKSNSATRFCKVCFKPIKAWSWSSLFGDDQLICQACQKELDPVITTFSVNGTKGVSCYFYNDAVKNKLFLLKGCFDFELAGIFLNHLAPLLRIKYRNFSLICAPSEREKDEARGFNHVEAIFACLRLPVIKAIRKTGKVKQADLHYRERQKVGESLAWNNGVLIRGKNILLVDDVMTTGATIKACLKLIKKHKPKKIRILVMSRTLANKASP